MMAKKTLFVSVFALCKINYGKKHSYHFSLKMAFTEVLWYVYKNLFH